MSETYAFIFDKGKMPKAAYAGIAAIIKEGMKQGYIKRTTVSNLSDWNIKDDETSKPEGEKGS